MLNNTVQLSDIKFTTKNLGDFHSLLYLRYKAGILTPLPHISTIKWGGVVLPVQILTPIPPTSPPLCGEGWFYPYKYLPPPHTHTHTPPHPANCHYVNILFTVLATLPYTLKNFSPQFIRFYHPEGTHSESPITHKV